MAGTFTLDDLYGSAPTTAPKVSEGRKIAEQAVEAPLQEVVGALPWAQAATGFAPLFNLPTGYDITPQQALEASRTQLGLSGQQPETLLGKGAGAALRAVASPSTYYTAPLFGMTGPLTTATTSGFGAGGAEIGGELAGLPGAVAGGFIGGGASLFSPTGMLLQGRKLWSQFKGAPNASEAVGSMVEAAGGKRAAGVAQKAFEADPTLQANLLRASEIEAITGVKLPTTAATQGSNVLLQEARSQAAKNPDFLAEIRRQEAAAKEQILKRAVDMFGQPSTERVMAATAKPASAVKSLEKRLSSIDDELAAIGNRVDNVDPTELGTRTANLVKAKEEIARQEVAPMYENALTDAEKAGIKLNPEQTQRLYDFVNSSVNQDVFKTFPTIYGKVNKVFGPELVGEGEAAQEVFKSATVRDLDSLKREINKQLYTTSASADTKRVVRNLRDQLTSVIDELPDSFRTPYRAADAAFLNKVGVPFDAKAIEDIGSKKFIEQTVPVLTKNSSAMNQFLDVAGDEGKNVIRDAFMYELSKTPNLIDEAGAINPKLVERFIAKNKDTLKNVPEVADEIRGLSNDSRALLATQSKLNQMIKSEQKREAENLFNRVNNQGLDATINQFFISPNQQGQILKELNQNPEAMKGFRAAVVEQLTRSGRTLDFFNENKDAMTKLFGSTYIKSVEALAEATQSLYQNPTKLNVPISTIRKTKFEETLGMSPESAVALARRQITSPFQKVTIGLSKFFQNKASQAEGEAIQDFLLDPKKIQDVAKLYGKMNEATDPKELASLAKQVVKATSTEFAKKGAFGSYLGVINGFGEEPQAEAPPKQQGFNIDELNFVPANPVTQ